MNELQTINFQAPTTTESAMAIEKSRAVTETQGAILIAKQFPRDENVAYTKIMTACQRISLANTAIYSYKRGGMVTGPSVRLAEVLARAWGNITYGFRELTRTETSSEIEAFCWDVENNVRVSRTFSQKHWRDTKTGGYALKDERDRYELIANMAQRRVRACILEIIPGDVVEAAVLQCNKTIQIGDGRPMEDRIRDMVLAFKELGISQNNIIELLGHKIDAIIPTEFVKLQGIFKAIKDGVSTREDFFTVSVKSTANDAFKKPEKAKAEPNTLHETKEWQQWASDRAMFPEIEINEPTTPEECIESCRELQRLVDAQNV